MVQSLQLEIYAIFITLTILNQYGQKLLDLKKIEFLLMPLGSMEGIQPGAIVVNTGSSIRVSVGEQLLGRVLNGLGNPIDTLGPLHCFDTRSIYAEAIIH